MQEKTKALEELLSKLALREAEGEEEVWRENNAKWREALVEILVTKEEALAVCGQKMMCSNWCLNEAGDGDF